MAFPSLLVWAVSSPAMAYVYYVVMRLPRGFLRLLASLPLIACYASVAKGFETVFERGVYSFFFIWLTSFKIVLLCWDDGPAADPWAVASFPRFLAVMTLSLQIKRKKFGERTKAYAQKSKEEVQDSNGEGQTRKLSAIRHNGHGITRVSASQGWGWRALFKSLDASQELHMVFLRLLFKFVVLMLITSSFTYRDSMPLALISLIYSFNIYVSCSLIFEGIAAVVSPLMGIELEAAFNKPFLAHSLTDFWGQRWNLLVSNLLRVSIFDPMLRFLSWSESRGSVRRPRTVLNHESKPVVSLEQSRERMAPNLPIWVRSVSMFSCFVVSGLMHELIFHNITKSKPSWQVTFFFVLNGVAALVEGAFRRKTRFRLSKCISTPLTIAFVLLTAIWFFFPPLVDNGAADIAIAEFQTFFHTLNQLLGGW